MAAKVTIDAWSPIPGALPLVCEPDKVYVLPTRRPPEGDEGDIPRYTDNVRYLPKEARENGLPVEFSMPEGSRKYLQEFSIDSETWALALALLTIASDWTIFTVERFIQHRARVQGWKPEEADRLPLKVSIAEVGKKRLKRTIEIEGDGDEVLEAIRILQNKESPAREIESP